MKLVKLLRLITVQREEMHALMLKKDVLEKMLLHKSQDIDRNIMKYFRLKN